MSERNAKNMRRIAKKYKNRIANDSVMTFLDLVNHWSFKRRLHLAWKVLTGKL